MIAIKVLIFLFVLGFGGTFGWLASAQWDWYGLLVAWPAGLGVGVLGGLAVVRLE